MYYRISAKADKNQSDYSYAKSICLVPATPGSITGTANLPQNAQGIVYSIAPVNGAYSYLWTAPPDATIVSGQGNLSITVNFGTNGGNVSVRAENGCGSRAYSNLTITVSSGLCNFGYFTDSRDGRTY